MDQLVIELSPCYENMNLFINEGNLKKKVRW